MALRGSACSPMPGWSFQNEGKAERRRAWHGCKVEAVYNIVAEGELRPSQDANQWEPFPDRAAGMYAHNDRTEVQRYLLARFVLGHEVGGPGRQNLQSCGRGEVPHGPVGAAARNRSTSDPSG